MTDQEKRDQAIALERRRWWELREAARRCIQISEILWSDRIGVAMKLQQELATMMRDRTVPGLRATGKEYEQDRHIPTPVFTPRDRLQFLKEFATTLLISARQQGLPVTLEAMREATQTDATDTVEAGSGVDETDADAEAQALDAAGEPAHDQEVAGLGVSEAPAS